MQLLAVPVHAAAAQLDGRHLVVIVRGELRDYDAATGNLLHTWPLPDVPSGGGCGSPHPWACPEIRLELVDASHELAAYVIDGSVHVVRLSDGVDKAVGTGTTARFMNAGLVYASGVHLRLVPFAQLAAAPVAE
jgi:NADPH-dependent 2,4-dienoyl-CoA reductase/sulfur reductase-like enzyme